MKWRNPKNDLPKSGERVWVMLAPHKYRGSLLASAMSIEIACGEASWSNDNDACRVENGDELGSGSISWYLFATDNYRDRYLQYGYVEAIAWLPLTEMPFPEEY